MKNTILAMLLTACLSFTSLIACTQHTEKIKQTAAIYAEALLSNDYKAVIDKTYPQMVAHEGGKDAFLKQLKAQKDEMASAGEYYSNVEIGNISQIENAGAQLHCILQQVFTIKTIGGIQNRLIPLLAISDNAGSSWTFINATKLNDPSVRLLFPNFNHNLKIPRSSIPDFTKDQKFSDEMIAYNRSFTGKLRRYNLEFNPPPSYVTTTEQLTFCGGISQHREGVFVYSLFSKVDKIKIFIHFNGIDTSNAFTFVGRDGVAKGPNNNYTPYRTKYDTFPEALTRKLYNADVSGTYDFIPCKNVPVIHRKEKCKVIFIHRENQVDIVIYYYYLPKNEHLLTKHMEATENMLRFKD